jgi:hypothetical protein
MYGRRKEKRLEKEATAADNRVERAKQGQRDAQSLRGMPGHKQALRTSASAINAAQRDAKKATKKLEKYQEKRAGKER